MLEEYKDVLEVKDLCRILRISRRLAYRLLDEQLPHRRIGASYRISKEELIRFLQGNDQGHVRAAAGSARTCPSVEGVNA